MFLCCVLFCFPFLFLFFCCPWSFLVLVVVLVLVLVLVAFLVVLGLFSFLLSLVFVFVYWTLLDSLLESWNTLLKHWTPSRLTVGPFLEVTAMSSRFVGPFHAPALYIRILTFINTWQSSKRRRPKMSLIEKIHMKLTVRALPDSSATRRRRRPKVPSGSKGGTMRGISPLLPRTSLTSPNPKK